MRGCGGGKEEGYSPPFPRLQQRRSWAVSEGMESRGTRPLTELADGEHEAVLRDRHRHACGWATECGG